MLLRVVLAEYHAICGASGAARKRRRYPTDIAPVPLRHPPLATRL
jgi:hypothetical protein